jgi:hypothetical protein
MNATGTEKLETATELYKRSYVNKDRIWKDYIKKSEFAANKWPENWGFLAGKLENVKFIVIIYIHS